MTTRLTTRQARHRRGVTLIELIIAMIVGLLVLTSVTAYVRTTDRNISGVTAREDYSRKARFLGIAFRRDFGEAGVGIESLKGFGTVTVFNDTVTILKVPFDNNVQDPSYTVVPPAGSLTPTANTNTSGCGNTCVRLRRVAAGTALTLASGMVARVQQSTTRRLIVVNAVGATAPSGATDSLSVSFRDATAVLRRGSITQAAANRLTGITISNTTVQRLDLVAYWRDASNNLWRATRINPATGAFSDAEIVATGCTQFEVQLVFQNGGVADNADSTTVGRFLNDINAITVRATLLSDYVDPRINGGVALRRTYTFRVQPRNLIYERNRDN